MIVSIFIRLYAGILKCSVICSLAMTAWTNAPSTLPPALPSALPPASLAPLPAAFLHEHTSPLAI